eukprot:TRINITY_DN2516_c0_g3_i2.p1 TRINITY_DN2516_c0_g3~~TRINITY_DN2516_c0_g3_i2.p1  ORF type:complete len:220 (+),score=50.36 TRINITY_DN2516_c0_g3_i2:589-1248(+)
MIQNIKGKTIDEVKNIDIHVGDVNALVRSYLLFYGYEETIKKLDDACGIPNETANLTSIHNRKSIRTKIINGEIADAIQLINRTFPSALDHHAKPKFLLACQEFIELIKRGKLQEAIEYAQKVLWQFKDLEKEEMKNLEQVMGLVAYPDPLKSPVSHLLAVQQRELVADSVNQMILVLENHDAKQSTLEKLLKHLTCLQNFAREENNKRGEIFNVSNYV